MRMIDYRLTSVIFAEHDQAEPQAVKGMGRLSFLARRNMRAHR